MENKLNSEVFHLGAHIVKHVPEAMDGKNKPVKFKIFLATQALLAIVGEEVVKVLLRKNFGLKGLSSLKLKLNIIFCVGISILEFFLSFSNDSFGSNTATSNLHFAGGMLYVIIAGTLLVRGIKHHSWAKKNKPFSDYTGDSDLLAFLKKDNWEQVKIQQLWEPLLFLAIGIFITLFNWVAGIPIIFCALTIWLSALVRRIMFDDTLEKTVSQINEAYNSKSFNEVS